MSFLRRAYVALGFANLEESLAARWCSKEGLMFEWDIIDCSARQDNVPFSRHKGMVYNAWFTSVFTPYLWAKLLL
jgi:hypothetical protein